MGIWGASLPLLRQRLGVSDGGISWLLVLTGLCAIVSMQFGGRLADRHGAKVPTFVAAVVMIVGLALLITASSYPAAMLAAALLGLGNGSMDVAMNALGVEVELARKLPSMSLNHAFFSVGNFVGAAVVLLAGVLLSRPDAGTQIGVAVVVAIPIALACLAGSWRAAPVGRVGQREELDNPTGLPRVALLLGVMALCFGITEGTGVDWSSIHVTDVTGVSPAVGALGLACVSAFMVVVRLFGDRAVTRFGRRTVVRVGSAIAVAGYLVAAFISWLPLVLVGWCLVGLGVGLIAPQIYGLAGHLGGGRILAIVTGFGYVAFLTGPAIIGGVAQSVGLQHAMLVPLISAVGLVLLSLRMPTQANADLG